MKKRFYKAIATVTDGNKKWDVTIYSMYETIEEARQGIERFSNHGYIVLDTKII